MNTNTITAEMGGKRNYWPPKYDINETPMITKNQKERLAAAIYQNITDENARELRLSELEDLTQADADYALYQFSTGHWA